MLTQHLFLQDRPKLSRRRPQSRKARMLAATSTGISFEDTTPTTPTTPTIPEVPTTEPKPSSKEGSPAGSPVRSPAENWVSSSADKSKSPSRDIFGNDDLLEGPSLHPAKPTQGGQTLPKDDLFNKDLFSGKSQSSSDDLFANSDKKDDTDKLFKSSEKSKSLDTKSTGAKNSHSNKEDDLFSPVPKADNVSALDTDDLFSSSATKKGDKSKSSATEKVKPGKSEGERSSASNDINKNNLPKTDNSVKSKLTDEDDIFGDSSLLKKKGMFRID